MDKKNWNWKTHLAVFVIGFFAGRFSKRNEVSSGYRTNTGTSAYGKTDEIVVKRQVEIAIESMILFFSVFQQALKEISEKHNVEFDDDHDWTSVDFDKSFNRAMSRIVKETGQTPRPEEINFVRRILEPVINKIITSMLSSTPPVPTYASEEAYINLSDLSKRIINIIKERGQYSLEDIAPEFEKILDQWKKETRPEPYVRSLSIMINAMKA